MNVALVHGYFLHDSGSGIYVRELAQAFVRLGHDVTLVCQEREPERTDFIDSAYVLDASNAAMEQVYDAPRRYAGSCRLVRPDLDHSLLVYVEGEFPGFAREQVAAFQNASAQQRDHYVASNIAALRTIFARWTPDLVLAQHLIMQPFVVKEALAGQGRYLVTEHGSALNFSVRCSEGLVPFALEGLAGATAVAAVSQPACEDLIAWAAGHDLDIAPKTVTMPPGIDATTFACAPDRSAALAKLRELVRIPAGFDIRENDDILVFAGSVRNTKGIQHVVAALPLIAQLRGRRVRLLVAGDGPARTPLEQFVALTAAGDTAGARAAVSRVTQLQSPAEWGDAVVDAPPMADGPSVAFLGHLDHHQLASVFAAADVALVPSVFPEAAALVGAEALMSGALALVTYQSGLQALGDLLAESFHDPVFTSLVPDGCLTARLAASVADVLDRYPTRGAVFRDKVRETALRRYPTWEGVAAACLELAAKGEDETPLP